MSDGPSEAHDLHELPEVEEEPLAELSDARPGQLLRLGDGQQVVLAEVRGDDSGAALGLVRVAWPPGKVLPLGEVLRLSVADLLGLQPIHVLGAWFPAEATPPPEQILLEAIRRGFITAHNCGVAWPLGASLQLSEQAAARLERYLFEVARSTGCAFPFHDIAEAMRGMHLVPRPDNPSLCDILDGDELSRHHRGPDADLLSFWARELRRRIHASDWVPPPL